jgi:hypothetical protein
MVKLLVLLIIAVEVSAMVHTYRHAWHASSCSSHHLPMDAIARARTGLYSTSSRGCRRHQRMTSFRLHFDATTTTALESASIAGGLYLLLQLVVYWRMQFVAAGKYAYLPTYLPTLLMQ